MKKTVLAVALVAMLGVGLTACLPPPAPPPEPVERRSTPSTQYGVGVHQIELHDWSRGIAPYGDFPGSDVRTIPTTVFYPVWEVPHSDLYLDHAPLTSRRAVPDGRVRARLRRRLAVLHGAARRIATAGYVVVAPTYPLLSGWPAGPTDTLEWDEHFTDTSFVISAMLAVSTRPTRSSAG